MAAKLAGGAAVESNEPWSDGQSVDRGPCMVAGYAIVPRVPAGNGQDEALCDLMAVLDSAGLCPFLVAGIRMEQIAELLSAATGVAFSQDEIAQAGRRISWAFRPTA